MNAMIALALAAFGGSSDGEQEKTPAPAPSAFVEPQDTDRPSLTTDLKLLRESNIYSPKRVIRKTPPPPPRVETPKEKPRPKPPVLTGIILDTETRSYQAVVEDRNDAKLKLMSEPKFLKAGDTVLVYTIESVEPEKVVVRFGETRKELKVGESLPDAGIKAPEGTPDLSADEGAEAAPSDAKTDAKTEAKKSDSSTTPPTLDDAARKKILEDRKSKLGKKRKTDEEN